MTSNESSADPLRLVFDTSVYIAARLSPDRYADSWLQRASEGMYQLFISPAIERELRDTLRKKGVSEIDLFLELVTRVARRVKPREHLAVVKADPDDNKILECAVEARADLIITMDKHLLRLKEFRGMGIAHPSDMQYILQDETDQK